MNPDRKWWLRVPAVLLSPRSVFAALRSEEQEELEARAEPVLALTLLAGIAVALGTSTARRLYDDPLYDPLTLGVWIVLAGGFVAFAGYFIVGGALYLGARGLGSEGTFRRARHVLGFAVAPLALSALLLWPLGLAIFGTDIFARDGSDEGAAGDVFYAAALAFSLWAVALLLLGVRTVHGWSWWRSLAALGLVALFLAAFGYVF
ncbi:MAG: Yip1 family protein [Gaiellaceae bacterium]